MTASPLSAMSIGDVSGEPEVALKGRMSAKMSPH